MKLDDAKYGHSDRKPKFGNLEACICHIKHTSVLIFFMVVVYLVDYKFTKIGEKTLL